MSTINEVAWLSELGVKPEDRQALEALVPEMVEETKKTEPGTRAYQFYSRENAILVYERYADSNAALEHMKNFGEKFAGRFMALVTPVSFTLLGSPSPELLAVVGPIGAVVNIPLGGYVI